MRVAFICAGLVDDPVVGEKSQATMKERREERREEAKEREAQLERRRKLLEKTLRVAVLTVRACARL